MEAERDELSSGLKVFQLREKLANFGLSTQGNKETLREGLASFLDADGSRQHTPYTFFVKSAGSQEFLHEVF